MIIELLCILFAVFSLLLCLGVVILLDYMILGCIADAYECKLYKNKVDFILFVASSLVFVLGLLLICIITYLLWWFLCVGITYIR